MNYLNLVYDLWEGNVPIENGKKIVKGEFKVRKVEGLLNFYKFRNCKSYRLDEIKNKPNENFYYFINNIQDIHSMMKDIGGLPMSIEVIDYLKSLDNFYLAFVSEHEYEPEKAMTLLIHHLDIVGIPHKKVYFINNNSNLNDYKKKYNTEINVHSIRFLPKITALNISHFESRYNSEKEGCLFMCHNRTPKPHRYSLLVLLKKYNILHEFDWSLVMGWEHKKRNLNGIDYQFYRNIFNNNEIERIKPEIDYFNGLDIKKSMFEEDKTWFDDYENHGRINWGKIFELKSYENNYINCVTESAYFVDDVHISEKSIKPMYFFQLPIFLASHNHVSKLKEIYNFDLFEDIINHDYDTIFDPRERFFKFFNEVTRLVKNRSSIIEFYNKNERRLWENKIKVMSLADDNHDFNFFKTLIYKNL